MSYESCFSIPSLNKVYLCQPKDFDQVALHFDRLAFMRMYALFRTKQDPIMSNVLYCSLVGVANQYKEKRKLNCV